MSSVKGQAVIRAVLEVEVHLEHELTIDTPDAWEPGYDYLVVRDASVVSTSGEAGDHHLKSMIDNEIDVYDLDPDALLPAAVTTAMRGFFEEGTGKALPQEVLIADLIEATQRAERKFQRYNSQRISLLPPSPEYPEKNDDTMNQWRERFPHRGHEEFFTTEFVEVLRRHRQAVPAAGDGAQHE